MRAAGISEFGGAVGRIDLPDPRPLADDEVLIKVRAAGVGNWEEFVRTSEWDVGRAPPMALGVEAAGTITAIGDSVEDWEPGDEVLSHPLPLRDQGTWAPLLIASATVLARKPASLSWEAAAAFPVPALTATQVIDGALAVRPDDLVLVNGGSGVTGTLLVGLAAGRRDLVGDRGARRPRARRARRAARGGEARGLDRGDLPARGCRRGPRGSDRGQRRRSGSASPLTGTPGTEFVIPTSSSAAIEDSCRRNAGIRPG